jgi:hypothetical protein
VIVRISNEAQYELLANDAEALNTLDNQAVAACEAGDEDQFNQAFKEMMSFVRSHGQRVPDDQLSGSDVILPPADSTMAEVRETFTGEGLIPE